MTKAENNKKHILIVDDDKFLLDMYAVKFSECGLNVETCHDAEEAIEKLREKKDIDAVLLDIIMPGADGFELMRRIKEEKLLPEDAVIIVLSNQGDDADIAKAKELGAAGYIVKASTIPSEVLEKVLKIMETKKGSSEV